MEWQPTPLFSPSASLEVSKCSFPNSIACKVAWEYSGKDTQHLHKLIHNKHVKKQVSSLLHQACRRSGQEMGWCVRK